MPETHNETFNPERHFEEDFPHVKSFILSATDLKDLSKLKRMAVKLWNNNEPGWVCARGAIDYFYDLKKAELSSGIVSDRSASDARVERILYTTNSDGKRSQRRW